MRVHFVGQLSETQQVWQHCGQCAGCLWQGSGDQVPQGSSSRTLSENHTTRPTSPKENAFRGEEKHQATYETNKMPHLKDDQTQRLFGHSTEKSYVFLRALFWCHKKTHKIEGSSKQTDAT